MLQHLVFIYGSLRRGCERPIMSLFPEARFIGEATVRGTMHDLGEYPGLRLVGSDSFVTGEAYEVDDATLKLLDEFEATSEYSRKSVEIKIGPDTKSGWTYSPDPKILDGRTVIESGEWVQYSRSLTN